ncbi:MAG: Ig-like domain-containing protein [Spirochaetota bacterium]
MKNLKKYYHIITILFLFLLASSCGKNASTVNPGDYTEGGGGGEPGYSYPYVTEVYPANATTAPINTDYVILFNIPVNIATLTDTNLIVTSNMRPTLIQGVDMDLYPGLNYARLDFTPDLSYGEIITVTTTAGIRDSANNIALNNPQSNTFTADTAPDTADPDVNAGTANPANTATDIAINTTVSIDFDETTIDPSTINSSTFYLERVSDSTLVTATYTYSAPTATLTPSADLLNYTWYRAWVTTGIRDLSGNYLPGNYFWTFRTVQFPDAPSGNPGIEGSPSISSVTDVSATINWTTNEATNYTINYDTGSSFGLTSSSASYTTVHSVALGALNDGKRYFYNIVFDDQFSGVPAVTSITYQFNTATAETPTTISGGANYQMLARYIPRKAGVTNSGAFMFWSDVNAGVGHISGKLYNSTFTQQWSSGIYTEAGQTYTYQSAVEDDAGGVIVLASHSTGLFAKRLNSGGTFVNWGTDADQATDRGLPIKLTATGTKISAAPVYSGFFTARRTGNATMNIPANPFYDFTQNLIAGITDGDIVYNEDTYGDATLTRSTNYRHVIGQSSVVITTADPNYVIADQTADGSGTAFDHHTYTTNPNALVTPYASGNDYVYTDHGVTTTAALTNLAGFGGNFARVIAITNSVGGITRIFNGVEQNSIAAPPIHVYDPGANYTGVPIDVGDYILNTSNPSVTTITDVTTGHPSYPTPPYPGPDEYLWLTNDIFNITTNENYNIYDRYCLDHSSDTDQFTAFDQIQFDNATINITAGNSYNIYNTGIESSAQSPPSNPLFVDGVDFSTGNAVISGDIVFNYATGTVGVVNNDAYRAYGALGINGPATMFSGTNGFRILRLATGYTFSDIIDSGIAAAGTTTTVLRDATISGAAVGDVVYNVTDATHSVIVSISAPDYTLAGSPSFAVNDRYIILRPTTGILYAWEEGTTVRWRIYTAYGTPPTPLNTEQTINNARNPIVISNGLGSAFIVYEDTSAISDINARLINAIGTVVSNTPIDTVNSNETIVKVISDNTGGFVVLYRLNATSALRVQRIDNAGAAQWGAGAGLAVGNPANIDTTTPISDAVDIVYDGANSVIVVAQIGNDIWARRVGTVWTDGAVAAGQYISNPAGTSIQQKPKIYTNWTDAIITWEDNRFVTGCGYGIFGMRIGAATGTKSAIATWDADSDAGTDMNGVSIILNSANGYWPNALIVPYNNNGRAKLIWDDWRNSALEDSNIESYDLYDGTTWFAPYP